jgi:hypothetical protein
MKRILDTLPGPILDDFGPQVRQLTFSQFLVRLHTVALNILPTAILELAQIPSTKFNVLMFISTSVTPSMRPLFCSSTHAPDCCCSPR